MRDRDGNACSGAWDMIKIRSGIRDSRSVCWMDPLFCAIVSVVPSLKTFDIRE